MGKKTSVKRMTLGALVVVAVAAVWACSGRQPMAPAGQQSAVPAEQQAAAEKALTWLHSQQQDNGSFDAGFGHPAGVTCDATLAVVAAGEDPAAWSSGAGKPSMAEYLVKSALEYAVDAATTGKLIVAIVAAGRDASDFGQDWVAHLQSFNDGSGAYDPGSVGQAWAILALDAAGEEISPEAVEVLKSYQLETGAWASAFGPDNDTVSYALQALVSAGEPQSSTAIRRALAFFQEQQNDDGGFPAIKPSDWGTDTNANSTANVIMALLAVGENPAAPKWTKAGGNPMTALLALQGDDGRIEFQPGVGEPLLSTVQAIPAVLNMWLPLRMER
ncbi:MAG: hypothetical protein JSW37_04870 [Anaerolineales bacterium]|nr:MAG: hypothetical protein JSW37_04870 [Anaerolineales bacterium]